MTFGSLFAGIGGMDLGLERAGMRCMWQVEIDDFARRVLEKHWPDVRRHDDVRTFPPGDDPEPWRCDLIAGGFPCQDISFAGKGAGLAGERSGLWFEFARVVRVLRPRYVLVENVAALLVRGMDAVLGTLAADGYDAEWACIPAAAVGAPHLRERVFVLAYAQRDGLIERSLERHSGELVGQAEGEEGRESESRRPSFPPVDGCQVLADINKQRSQVAELERLGIMFRDRPVPDGWWATEPDMGRVAHGVPARVDRLRGLGNAVVPQVAEWIGRRIMSNFAGVGS